MRRRHAIALAAAVLSATGVGATSATAAPAPRADDAASGGSILYRKGGSLWVVSPSGSGKQRIKNSKGLSNPSQDDRGRVVGQKGILLYRLSRRGKRLNKPITTAFRTSPIVPAFKGPFFPEVSPDGKKIAYTYSFTESHYDPGCQCVSNAPSLNTAYTYSNRFVEDPDRTFGHMRFYYRGSWMGSQSFLATTPNLYDYGGNVLDTVAVDPLGGGADSYQHWFTECTECSSIQTLEKYPLDEAELTRKRDKAVFVAGDLNATQAGSMLFVYPLAQPPTAIPSHFCRITGPNGKFTSPTWSPDGKSLAWADRSGIWVGTLGNLAGDNCEVSKRLVLRGGSAPDWGPARP
jgi:WD40 repeat protein